MDSRTKPAHMINSTFDFRSLGAHMPRRRIERGYVYKTGKATKMWLGQIPRLRHYAGWH